MRRSRLSLAQARRIALAAQGFDRARPQGTPDARHFRRVIETLGVLQLDYVNVLIPAHVLVLWSRLGPYERSRFERYAYGSGECTEQWAHEASIVPASSWSLFDHRRKAYRMHKHNPLRRLRNRHAYLKAALEQVQNDGAVTANDLPPLPGPRRKPGDWHRSIPRWALDYHYNRGSLVVLNRLPNFQRVYDLPERVLPDACLSRSLTKDEAQLELLRCAARAMGVATMRDLADYFRMSPKESTPLLAQLVDEGAISRVEVDGWNEPAYLYASAKLPREIRGASLLSPFDPVVWYRPRAERLFGFHYRIEIYVPAAQRKWGYYVLPFRVGESIVARVDLKADRKAKKLLVMAAHEEEGIDRSLCVDQLVIELHALKDWLELDDVRVTRHNALTKELAAAV